RANLFISPYSISSVLQMVNNGARGETQDELQKVLGLEGLTGVKVNEAYENLAQAISSAETNVTLHIANALWYRTGSELKPEFAAINQKFYRATLGALDFADPRSAEVMNEWASQNTHGKIQTIMQPPIPENTAIV